MAVTSGFLAILYGTLWAVQVDSAWRWPFPVFPFKYEKVTVEDTEKTYKPEYINSTLWEKMENNQNLALYLSDSDTTDKE